MTRTAARPKYPASVRWVRQANTFGILTFVRLLRDRRRRWAVRFANGRIHPLRKEQEAREMAYGGAWGRPALLHRVDADSDWVEHP